MKNKFLKVFLMIGMLFIGIGTAHAEDGNFTFKIGGAENVKPGSEFTVDVSVDGPSTEYTLNGYDISISYDTAKLTLIEGAPNNRISGSNLSLDSGQVLATLKFRANEAGNSTLKLTGNSILVNGDESTATFNSGTVSIRSLGSDSSLKSLKIPNTTLSPAFDKNKYNYTATVTDVTSVDIEAKPTDSNSSVSITPNASQLVKGENDISIVCKSETGKETVYTIKVTLNLTPTEEELQALDASLKNLTVKGYKLDFTSNEKKYYLEVDYDVTKLTVNATPTNSKATVKISGDKKLVVGKNTIKLVVTSEDKTKTETYQIIVTRLDEEKEVVKTCPDQTSKKEWIVFTISMLLTFTLGIVLGYFLCRKEVFNKLFKKNKKEDVPVEIETLSDTIDLSSSVKQVKEEEERLD